MIPALIAEFRHLSLVQKTVLMDNMCTWPSSEIAVKALFKIQQKEAHLSGSGWSCQETSNPRLWDFIQIMMWETCGRKLFSPATSIHIDVCHEMQKPCLNFSPALSNDVNKDDTIMSIIINNFYAGVDEAAETVVWTKQFRLPMSKDLRHETTWI